MSKKAQNGNGGEQHDEESNTVSFNAKFAREKMAAYRATAEAAGMSLPKLVELCLEYRDDIVERRMRAFLERREAQRKAVGGKGLQPKEA